MTDHPSTFQAKSENTGKIDWDDRASLRCKDGGDGLLHGAKGLRRGTLAELIRHMMLLPEAERSKYVIQKAGDHCLTIAEIETLAARDDFPRR